MSAGRAARVSLANDRIRVRRPNQSVSPRHTSLKMRALAITVAATKPPTLFRRGGTCPAARKADAPGVIKVASVVAGLAARTSPAAFLI
ncbi:MAG: hypothetical protein AMJ46_07770 [Latescibacteria bacterium DG_63]|uniref:Uncharacterized protein n=1 Tax=candidate division TA06 bacterium SM1_40 TaxID=1703773 RepID=A0A0S8JHW0_UNCT6|nr:MAG: hypothetical protein AMJ46_07770 [Latescibacteria bacterium DG_63]KPL09364.1 MAG: hypothetical protein AMJ71_06630 [candidate division TA06 bacterium SM1_40]